MHSEQLMLVEINTAEEAKILVTDYLNDPKYGGSKRWWNSYEIGGRYVNTFEGFSDDPVALLYSDNPLLAQDKIDEAVRLRQGALIHYANEVVRLGLSDISEVSKEYDPYDEYTLSDSTYSAKSLLDIMGGRWSHDSGVYDLSGDTTNLKYFKERLDKSPSNQYIVVVDFNY